MSGKTPCRHTQEIRGLPKGVVLTLPSVKESLPQALNQVLIFLVRGNTFRPLPRTELESLV